MCNLKFSENGVSKCRKFIRNSIKTSQRKRKECQIRKLCKIFLDYNDISHNYYYLRTRITMYSTVYLKIFGCAVNEGPLILISLRCLIYLNKQ